MTPSQIRTLQWDLHEIIAYYDEVEAGLIIEPTSALKQTTLDVIATLTSDMKLNAT